MSFEYNNMIHSTAEQEYEPGKGVHQTKVQQKYHFSSKAAGKTRRCFLIVDRTVETGLRKVSSGRKAKVPLPDRGIDTRQLHQKSFSTTNIKDLKHEQKSKAHSRR
ncbi:MAG: hypothetical protein J6C40_07980 [Lentisphaeria bacterium]|nr:hypothetical protein [Lentisphaeria bacterium]